MVTPTYGVIGVDRERRFDFERLRQGRLARVSQPDWARPVPADDQIGE
jgi:hypothetical protein